MHSSASAATRPQQPASSDTELSSASAISRAARSWQAGRLVCFRADCTVCRGRPTMTASRDSRSAQATQHPPMNSNRNVSFTLPSSPRTAIPMPPSNHENLFLHRTRRARESESTFTIFPSLKVHTQERETSTSADHQPSSVRQEQTRLAEATREHRNTIWLAWHNLMDLAGRQTASSMIERRVERHPSNEEKAGFTAGRGGIPSTNTGKAHRSLQR
jgi:hypothetical protein